MSYGQITYLLLGQLIVLPLAVYISVKLGTFAFLSAKARFASYQNKQEQPNQRG